MANSTVEQDLIADEHELNDCIIRGDIVALEHLLADEYVLIVPDLPPGRFSRDQDIAVARTVAARSYRSSDFLIRPYGEVAVVSALRARGDLRRGRAERALRDHRRLGAAGRALAVDPAALHPHGIRLDDRAVAGRQWPE